jgi:hypothetical protein
VEIVIRVCGFMKWGTVSGGWIVLYEKLHYFYSAAAHMHK